MIIKSCDFIVFGVLKVCAFLRLQKQDERRKSSEPDRDGAVLPFKAVGSGAPAFAPPSLRKDDKAVRMPDLPFLSPAPIKTSPAAATGGAEESRRQLVGFAQEAARAAAALAPAAPSLSLQAQSQQTAQQQQQARKARRCWSPELHRQFVTALHQLGGPQGESVTNKSQKFPAFSRYNINNTHYIE